jgi:transcriptional regulator with XRE-family HTH domain
MNLSDKIIQLRKLKGWSQNELSKKIEVSREIIGRYERSDATPSIDIAKRMAEAFEVSLDYLVGNAEEKVDKATLDRVLEINKLPGEDKKVVFALLDAFITNRKLKSVIQ